MSADGEAPTYSPPYAYAESNSISIVLDSLLGVVWMILSMWLPCSFQSFHMALQAIFILIVPCMNHAIMQLLGNNAHEIIASGFSLLEHLF